MDILSEFFPNMKDLVLVEVSPKEQRLVVQNNAPNAMRNNYKNFKFVIVSKVASVAALLMM